MAFQGAKIVDDLPFRSASSREAQVDIIEIEPPGKKIGIGIPRAGGTGALGDGGAVKHHGVLILIGGALFHRRSPIQPHQNPTHVDEGGEAKGDLAHFFGGKAHMTFISSA